MDSASKSFVDLYAQDAALDAELIHEALVSALAEGATYRLLFLDLVAINVALMRENAHLRTSLTRARTFGVDPWTEADGIPEGY